MRRCLLTYAGRVTEPSTSEFRPWRLRGSSRLEARRRELFASAAPVFRRYGYRGATIKALAHACGLSPASLYHYFGSKEEMATYLVRRPRMDWDSTWVDLTTSPDRALAGLRRGELRQALDDEGVVVQLGEPGDDDDADGTPVGHDQWEAATVRCVLGEFERRRLGE